MDESKWLAVPTEIGRLVKEAAPIADIIKACSPDLDPDSTSTIWYSPDNQCALVHEPDTEKVAAVLDVLTDIPQIKYAVQTSKPPEHNDAPWLLIKCGMEVSKVLGPIAMLTGHRPGIWPMAPNTVTATLGSGLLGAGLGYGAGWLGEHLLPDEHFRKGKLRLTGAMLGGAAGAIPSAWYGLRGGYKQSSLIEKCAEELEAALSPIERELDPLFTGYAESFLKSADDSGGLSGGGAFLPVIPTDQFNQAILADPFTPMPLKATTAGLVTAASMSRGDAPWVSPMDIAQIGISGAAGALTGFGTALVAGKVLGALAGLKPESQQTLQRYGTWAGILANVVPRLFGG